jgi:Calpain family cysteine protease
LKSLSEAQDAVEAWDSSFVAMHKDDEDKIIITTLGFSTGKNYEEYMASMRIENGRLKDTDFDPTTEVSCKRFSEIEKKLDFDAHGLPPHPSPDDVMQGALGDCYYLSAIATIAERPELLQVNYL